MGVPTVSMATSAFVELATSTAFKKGIPNLKITFTPHPITDRPTDVCDDYIKGDNPVSGNAMMAEIVGGLTAKLANTDTQAGMIERGVRQRFLPSDTPENLERMFHDKMWTDGLPIVLPTEERVKAMLVGTSHDPDEIVASMQPSPPHEAWEFTVEMVAINAVMAGAKPEYLPTILAIASSGVSSLFSSTSSFARMAVINGPVRNDINMNASIGALGPFNHANSTIGRAWLLLSKNLGGSGLPGSTYLGSQGNALNYNNLTFPEAEEALPPGWQPLHVQKGFDADESVVSLFSGWSLNDIAWYSPLPQHEVIKNWLSHFFSYGTSRATLILDPIVAADLDANGFATKQAFTDYLVENSTTPGWLYWSTHEAEYEQAKNGVEPFASYLALGKTAEVPVSRFVSRAGTQSPIDIVAVGGSTNTFWSGGDFGYLQSVSIDDWK